MANKNPVTWWLLSKRSLFSPKFTGFSWPSRYFPGIHDFSTRITIGDLRIEGRGIDENQELALEKSACEAIERLICHRLNISSTGVAVAGNHSAKDHASNEALERYFLNEHLRTKRPFRPVPATDHSLSAICSEIQQAFSHYNPEAKAEFYFMATPKEYFGSVCQISYPDQPKFLGFSLSQTPQHSLDRAFREACVNFARMKDSPEAFRDECQSDPNLWQLQSPFLDTITPLLGGAGYSEASLFDEPEQELDAIDIGIYGDLNGCPIQPIRVQIRQGGEL